VTDVIYGSTRLGLLVPSGNSVAETELLAMLTDLENAAALLGHAEPDAIAFHCTAVSTFAPHLAGEIRSRITAATGRPAIATADAILAALRVLDARRVLLVTPYIEPVHQREIGFLAAQGLLVTGGSCLGIDTNTEMARIAPDVIAAQVREAASNVAADACFISCTAIRSAGLIQALEASLGMPVITSNQVLAWHALCRMGVGQRISGFGRLFDIGDQSATSQRPTGERGSLR
jgi:maleate isomerase